MSTNDMAVGDDMAIADMGPPDDARMFVTFTMFAQQYAQAVCDHDVACGLLDVAQMPACLERNLRHTGWDQDTEIMKGRMQINDLQCLDAIKNSRCDNSDTVASVGRCVQFLYSANQANGAACLASEECKSGFCQHGGSDGGMTEQPEGCPGTCAPPRALGSACRTPSDCTPDATCDQSTHMCAKLGALNDACANFLGAGSGQFCQFGLMCPTFPSGTPTCVVASMQTTLHGACDPFQGVGTATPACSASMYCQLHYTATATSCTGAPGQCYPGYCDTGTMLCQTPSGGTCEDKIATTGDCDPNNVGIASFAENQCADGTGCLQLPTQTKYTCQPLVGAAGDCGDSTQCKLGLSCINGKCAAWFNDGQVCGATPNAGMCPSKLCISEGSGAAPTCQPAKSFGASCVPVTEDSLCVPSDTPGSTGCAATTGGMGVCAPKCF